MSETPTPPGMPKLFAVLGHPVGHSRSPAMHQAALDLLGLPHRYLAFDVRPAALADALKGALAMGMGGLNLTVPLKKPALRLCDALTQDAERIGAVNTIRVERDRLVGDNTDGIGFARAVRELPGTTIRHAVVLGAGGASRAVIDTLRRPPKPPTGQPWEPLVDPVTVRWISRRPEALPDLPGVRKTRWDDINEVITKADLLVNATTVGMKHGPVGFPIPIDPSRLPEGARVVDVVYPRPTWGLLDAAEQAGKATQDGLPMLLWQGVAALERWLGRTLPAEVVAAMRKALHGSSGAT